MYDISSHPSRNYYIGIVFPSFKLMNVFLHSLGSVWQDKYQSHPFIIKLSKGSSLVLKLLNGY